MNDDKIRVETRFEAAVAHRKKYLGAKCKNCRSREKYTSSGRCADCQKSESKFKADLIKLLLDS